MLAIWTSSYSYNFFKDLVKGFLLFSQFANAFSLDMAKTLLFVIDLTLPHDKILD